MVWMVRLRPNPSFTTKDFWSPRIESLDDMAPHVIVVLSLEELFSPQAVPAVFDMRSQRTRRDYPTTG